MVSNPKFWYFQPDDDREDDQNSEKEEEIEIEQVLVGDENKQEAKEEEKPQVPRVTPITLQNGTRIRYKIRY